MTNNKMSYQSPKIEIISLDKEISLILNSLTPPEGPDEGEMQSSSHIFNNTALKA